MTSKGSKTQKTNWLQVRFGDVVRQCKEKADPESSGLERYIAGDHMDTDDLRLRRWGEIGSGYLGPAFHMRFKPGQVLYGSRRTYLRKVAVASFDGICANTTFVLESKQLDVLLPDFLPFLMQTKAFNEFSIKHSKGSVNPYINFSDLADYEFTLPPVKEQRTAIFALRSMDSTHAAIEGVGQTHRQLVESFIQTEFANFDAQCPHLPCKDTMRNITVGIVVKPADLYVEKGDGVLALRSLNLFPNRFLLDDVVEISHAGHAAHSKSALDAGDVVVVRTGRPGDAAVVPEELSGINCIDLIVAKPSAALDPFYVVTFLNSQFGRRIFSSGTTGTAQQHFNVGEFSKLKIPIPPKQIQHAFVDKLRSFEKVGSEVSARVAALRDTRSLFLNSTVFGAE